MDGVDTTHSTAEAHDAALLQTSALRLSAEALAADPGDERSLSDIVRAGRALTGALRRPGLEVLLDGGDVLEKMALLGRTLSTDDKAAATAVFRGLTRAVGILEQSLDAVLAGAAAEQLEDYGDAMLEAFPARWRPYLEPEEEEPQAAPQTAPPAQAAAGAAEPSVATTFLVEVLDHLAACEEAALEWDGADAARRGLETIEGHLETIEDAFAAVGLAARILAEARRVFAGVREDAEAFPTSELAEVVLEIVAWARSQAARACDLATFATDIVPDLRRERLQAQAKSSAGDAMVDVDRALLRLRRPLRAAAAACGCWADLDAASPALRLDRAVAERVARALSVLLRSAFDDRGEAQPGVLRILRVRVESWEPASVVVVVDEVDTSEPREAGADAEHDGAGQPEALHGIDVTRDPLPEDWERLVYRPGFANVVVMVIPEGSLHAEEHSS